MGFLFNKKNMVEDLKNIKFELFEIGSIIHKKQKELDDLSIRNNIAIHKLSNLINQLENQSISSRIEESIISKKVIEVGFERGFNNECLNYVSNKE